jgi:indole-3-glycerol phosphate synthase
VSDAGDPWPERRFSQAISEGDGISVIPRVWGELERLARAAASSGAEALAVDSIADLASLRGMVELPLIVRHTAPEVAALEAARRAGADAVVVHFAPLADEEGLLEELVGVAWELGLDCALDVRDEGELEQALERLDPEILVLSERDPQQGELELDRTLDLLADVPAGKLVVSESTVETRDQVLALERAGVDAVLLATSIGIDDRIAAVVATLTGRAGAV